MSERSRICSGLRKAAREAKNEKVLDVFAFGSFVKGKARPSDVDVCVVFLEKIDSSVIDGFYSKCNKLGINVHVSPLVAENFFLKAHSLATTVLREGVSLLDGEQMAKRYGMGAWALYSYEISKMSPGKRVKFVYLMKGRGGNEGLVKGYGGFFMSPGCFLIPVGKDGEMLEVLERWKVKYTRKNVLLIS